RDRARAAFWRLCFWPPLSPRRRICRGGVEPGRARRDAPGLGRSGRRPLPRTDGRLRQAARSVREGLHGAHQAVPVLGGLPRTDAPDGTRVERVEYARPAVGRPDGTVVAMGAGGGETAVQFGISVVPATESLDGIRAVVRAADEAALDLVGI